MNIAILLLSALVLSNAGFITNTTDFWKQTLKETSMHYQAFSGYQQIDWYHPKGTTGMFYQLYGAPFLDIKTQGHEAPLFIWLQGGPGASSQFAAHTEIGPISFQKGQAKNAKKPWNIFGNWLFIDQPLNVGFSYSNTSRNGKEQVSSAHQAADHLVNFLHNFYETWPALSKSDLYITGQSFGGHYVPAFARNIIINNKNVTEKFNITLKGIGIGDGWTDPINQVNFYDSYLYSVGIVSNKFRDACTWFQTNAIVNIYNNEFAKATQYFDFLTNNDTTPEVYFGGISMFNFRNYDGLDESFADFLQKNKAQFGAKVDYIPGNDAVYTAFAKDVSTSYANDVIIALRNTRVLIYNGQDDLVVNTPGVLQYLNSLNWSGIWDWKRASKEIWTLNGEVKGWAKVSGNLWFVLVNQAGHMVPSDQPDAAFSMMGHFVSNQKEWRQ